MEPFDLTGNNELNLEALEKLKTHRAKTPGGSVTVGPINKGYGESIYFEGRVFKAGVSGPFRVTPDTLAAIQAPVGWYDAIIRIVDTLNAPYLRLPADNLPPSSPKLGPKEEEGRDAEG